MSQPLKVKKSVKCKDGQFVSFAPQEVSPYEQMREEHINHLHNTIIKLKSFCVDYFIYVDIR